MSNISKDNGVPRAEAERALTRILDSSLFSASNRLSRFLRFTVEQTLSGNADQLKEYTVGTTAYGRKSDFDPSHDTIVRTEARRLRRKLKEYYEGDGKQDEVLIFFRTGSYVPVIHWRQSIEGGSPSTADAGSDLWAPGDGVCVTVLPFVTQPGDTVASSFAFGLAEEILHGMIGLPGVRAFFDQNQPSIRPRTTEGQPIDAVDTFQVAVSGTVRTEQNSLRVTARVTTANGLVLWSQRYDTGIAPDSLLDMQEAVASALFNLVAPREPLVQQFARTPTETLYKLYAQVLTAETLLEEGSIPNTVKALAKFEELKTKAPNYTRLDCGIAQCCIGLALRGDASSDRLLSRAATIGEDLLRQWPGLPDAHAILAMTLARDKKWQAAEESFRVALKLGRQHAIHRQFAVYLMAHGRYHEAWEHLQIAQSIDLFSNRQKTSMGHFFYCSGWHAAARSYYGRMVGLDDLQIEPAYFYALTYVEMNEPEKALEVASRLERHVGSVPTYMTGVAELFAVGGDETGARRLIDRGNLFGKDAGVSSFRLGCLALALKETERALEYFDDSLSRREPEIQWAAVEPRFKAVADHPAYRRICEAVLEPSSSAAADAARSR